MGEPETPAEPEDVARTSSDVPAALEHELMNALASIVGFSQVIRRDPSLPDDLRHSADLLVEEATRTRALVADLLRLARARPAERDRVDETSPAADRTSDLAHTPGTANTPRPRVLVLDNDPSMRVFLEKALVALGYEPVMTERGEEAVRLATTGEHAVALFDQQMPGMSGADAYEAIVAARPDLGSRFVMMSGDVADPGLDAFAAARPVTLLAKPFDLDTLDRTIRAVLEAPGQSRG